MIAKKHHFEELTSCRFLAAAIVFMAHIPQAHPLPYKLLILEPQARAGVCFFFILSGFILTYTYQEKLAQDGMKTFFIARFARIYPIYLATLLAAIPLSLLAIHRNPNFAAGVDASTLTWANATISWITSALSAQIYIPQPHFTFLWDSPNWSIPCEVIFYLCFQRSSGS